MAVKTIGAGVRRLPQEKQDVNGKEWNNERREKQGRRYLQERKLIHVEQRDQER